MTNSDTTSSDVRPAGARRRRVRPFLKGILATVVALLGVGYFAAPAFAHSNAVSGVASCPSGATQTIVWTIANDYNLSETAGSFTTSASGATFSASSVSIALTPTGTPQANWSTGTVTETLPATATGTVTFTETGTWSDGHTQTVPTTVSLATGCPPPKIAVTKSVSPSSVAAGSATHIVYTLAVHNSGSLPTTTVTTVTDAIPAGLTYVAGSASCGTTPSCTAGEAAGVVTYVIQAPIYGGVTDNLTFAVTANANDPTGTITNTGAFTGPGCVPTAPATTCPTNPVPVTVTNNAALLLVKTASTGNVTAGQTAPVTYTLTVSNPAPANSTTLTGATVSDVVPSGLTYVAGSASCGSLNAGSTPSCSASYNAAANTVGYTLGAGIAAGASYPVTFQATVNAADTTSIVNTATLTGPGCNAGIPASTCSSTVTITVTNPGCTTAGGCSTNTTDNPVPPPTTPGSPVTKVQTGSKPTPISGATTVHTGEPWAGSSPYVLAALAFGISLLGLGTEVRRRRTRRVPTA